MTDDPQACPLTDQQLNEYAVLAETAAHLGETVNPRTVIELVAEVRRRQQQVRLLLAQIARQGAVSGDADRRLGEFLAGDEAAPTPTPLTDGRNPAGSREPLLWNDSAGNLLSIYPDCVDDEDRPTVALEIREPIFNGFFHVAQAEAPRLAADLCAAAGFRELSEQLLTDAANPTP